MVVSPVVFIEPASNVVLLSPLPIVTCPDAFIEVVVKSSVSVVFNRVFPYTDSVPAILTLPLIDNVSPLIIPVV